MKKRCEICKKPFVAEGNRRFCSHRCFRQQQVAKRKNRRKTKAEWYRRKEPEYYVTYRAKLLSKRPWRYLLASARARAKEKHIIFDLTDEWAAKRWTGHCEITGLAFRVNGKRGPFPFSPSVDRIKPEEGYTETNTRFILWGCNAIKSVGTDTDMYEIAQAIVDAKDTHLLPSIARTDLRCATV